MRAIPARGPGREKNLCHAWMDPLVELMLSNLWIIHRETGICIYDEKISDRYGIDFDSDLFTGFVSAIFSFSREITAGKFETRSISLGPLRISYEQDKHILVSVAVDDRLEDTETRKILEKISRRFLDRYEDLVKPGKFNHDVLQFRDFGGHIEDIKKRYVVASEGAEAAASRPAGGLAGKLQSLVAGGNDEEIRKGEGGLDERSLEDEGLKRERESEPVQGPSSVRDLSREVSDTMVNFLKSRDESGAGGHSFENLAGSIKDMAKRNAEKVKKALKMAKQLANRVLPEFDFNPLFSKLKQNTLADLGGDDDYSF